MQCENAVGLVPSYLDGELSETQAAPLRGHLLACPTCREVAKGERSLKRWFVAEEASAVPAGFAARVARRAFAGDPGMLDASDEAGERAEPGAILPFVQTLTAVAAAILLVLALAIQRERLPDDAGLRAESADVLEELERLNAEEEALLDARGEDEGPETAESDG